MALHRVTWVSQFTKRVNHHDAEELDVAQAHLAFLRARHPFIEYTLEAAPADADHANSSGQGDLDLSGQSAAGVASS